MSNAKKSELNKNNTEKTQNVIHGKYYFSYQPSLQYLIRNTHKATNNSLLKP